MAAELLNCEKEAVIQIFFGAGRFFLGDVRDTRSTTVYQERSGEPRRDY